MDWRDLIPRINLPILIISGRASGAAPWKSQGVDSSPKREYLNFLANEKE
jgi:hypothetical protein